MKRKLIIDGQIYQTHAKDRGMGRYSIYLIRSIIAANSFYDEIEIVLTNNIATSAEAKRELKTLFPGVELTELDLKIAVGSSVEQACKHNKSLLNRYVDKQRLADYEVDYLILSLFQEPLATVFPRDAKKLLLFYDLIPYLYHQRYELIMGPTGFDNYLKRFKYIYEADSIFAISQTALDDLHIYLGVPAERIVRIDGAAIRSSSKPKTPRVAVPGRFVLMPTSDDPRKNNIMAVLGFEEYLAGAEDSDVKLVITSRINKKEKEYLTQFSKNLVFTGNLVESELDWLYEQCEAVLFVPEYEGLGLPVLEAVEFGKPVACSSIGAFKEISANAFCYCDHQDTATIAEAIGKALTTKPNLAAYAKISGYYTWDKTARRLLDGAKTAQKREVPDRLKAAVFAPVPDGLSAIGKIVAESHAALSEHFKVDYYLEEGMHKAPTRPNFLKYIAKTYPAEAFNAKKYADYDAVIYHIGNGDYHLQSIKNALYLPGYAIIHETNISEAWRVMVESGLADPERASLEAALSKTGPNQAKYLSSVVDRQLGVLTHSQYAKKVLSQISNKPLTTKSNLPSATPQLYLNRPSKKFVIGLAGIIADAKGLEILESIALNPLYKECEIKLFGFSFVSDETIGRLNSYENVTVAVGVTDLEFQNNLSKLDIFVNYRLDYKGETSLSTIEAMRSGVAVIVRDIGWYGELPDDAVVKASSIEDVFEKLNGLIVSKQTTRDIGKRAKQYIADNFTHEQYTADLRNLIEESSTKGGKNHELADALKKHRLRRPGKYLNFIRRLTML